MDRVFVASKFMSAMYSKYPRFVREFIYRECVVKTGRFGVTISGSAQSVDRVKSVLVKVS